MSNSPTSDKKLQHTGELYPHQLGNDVRNLQRGNAFGYDLATEKSGTCWTKNPAGLKTVKAPPAPRTCWSNKTSISRVKARTTYNPSRVKATNPLNRNTVKAQGSKLGLISDISSSISKTNQAVDTFIQDINYLNRLNNTHTQDFNKIVTSKLNSFNKNKPSLTDDHRKQILRITPEIGKLVNRKDLDSISLSTILYSLSKIDLFCKLDQNKTLADDCVQYEQASKNLISTILIKILKYKTHKQRQWSNIFYALGLLVKQSAGLITKVQISNLVGKFTLDINEEVETSLNGQDISNIFLGIVQLLEFDKLDSKSSAVTDIIEYFLKKIPFAICSFNYQEIANTIHSIAKLSEDPEINKVIDENITIIELLLQECKHKISYIDKRDVSAIFYGLGVLSNNIYFDRKLYDIVRSTYKPLLTYISDNALKLNIEAIRSILHGIKKLIECNIITDYKPDKGFIRNILLNKVIADPSIINDNELYNNIYHIAFFQEYLTTTELIKIFKDITFFTPSVKFLKIYFTSMGYLLVKIHKELKNDSENPELKALEYKVETAIKETWKQFQPNIENFNHEEITAIRNTCSLIYKAEDLTCLRLVYKKRVVEATSSTLEDVCIPIIKTLIPNPENLKLEYSINNLPPVDACITYPDGTILAIEIQGRGHYIDNEGKYPSGRHLLKMARLQKENVTVIEVNATTFMGYDDYIETATYLINILLENHIEIRPEYKDNIPQLLQDSGITS
jgi:hypothetical protein